MIAQFSETAQLLHWAMTGEYVPWLAYGFLSSFLHAFTILLCQWRVFATSRIEVVLAF